MERSTKVAKTFAVALFLAVALLSGAIVFAVNAYQKRQEAGLAKTRDEAVAKLKEINALISERATWEAKEAAATQELARYNLVLPKGAPMPRDGFSYVYADEYEPTLYRDLQRLAEYTGCTFDLWQLSEYTRRPTESRPARQEGETAAAADPAKEQKYKRDEDYLRRLGAIQKVADIQAVNLRIRGRMENVQLFIVGLSGFQVPTGRPGSPYWYFPELVALTNLSMRAIDVDPEFISPGNDDPILEATLECRYFPFKPLAQPSPVNHSTLPSVPAPMAASRPDPDSAKDPALAPVAMARPESAFGGERPMAAQAETSAPKSATTQYIILGVLVVVLVVVAVWFWLSGRRVATTQLASATGTESTAGDAAEDVEGLPERNLQPAEMQIIGESPFLPKKPGSLERPGVPLSAGTRTAPPRNGGAAEEAPEVPESESEGPAGEPKAEGPTPRPITQPPAERPSDTGSGLPGVTRPGGTLPPVTPPPTVQTPTPEPEVAAQPDRTTAFFQRFATPGMGGGDLARPSRDSSRQLQVTGTIVGADGGTMAILTDGTRPYYVRQGQQLTVQGRPTRVLSIDRGSVTLEHGPETVTLHSIGGAGQ